MYLAAGIGGTAGQIEQHGLYYFLAALVLIVAGVIAGVLTGKIRLGREVESAEKQLQANNVLLASYDTSEVKRTREALEVIEDKVEKLTEENRLLRETITRQMERQDEYERRGYNTNRMAGGGGNNA